MVATESVCEGAKRLKNVAVGRERNENISESMSERALTIDDGTVLIREAMQLEMI
jgi:hypothetical protein